MVALLWINALLMVIVWVLIPCKRPALFSLSIVVNATWTWIHWTHALNQLAVVHTLLCVVSVTELMLAPSMQALAVDDRCDKPIAADLDAEKRP